MFSRDPKRIKIWHNVASNVQKLVQICKTLKTKPHIQLFLRYMPLLIKQFLNIGMPIFEHNLKYQTNDVTAILKMMQSKKQKKIFIKIKIIFYIYFFHFFNIQ
jgi:hypothetical protein